MPVTESVHVSDVRSIKSESKCEYLQVRWAHWSYPLLAWPKPLRTL